MRHQYQEGHLRCRKRKFGPSRWEYLWREDDEFGNRICRTTVIGGIDQYPTSESALAAVNGLKMQINMDRYRRPGQVIYITDLIDHYFLTELSEDNERHSLATRMVHRDFIEKWVRSHWGKMPLECVRTVAVEHWLRRLQRNDKKPLANTTKAKIRSLFSTLFNHGIRYEWLGQGKNPIKMVRQSRSLALEGGCRTQWRG